MVLYSDTMAIDLLCYTVYIMSYIVCSDGGRNNNCKKLLTKIFYGIHNEVANLLHWQIILFSEISQFYHIINVKSKELNQTQHNFSNIFFLTHLLCFWERPIGGLTRSNGERKYFSLSMFITLIMFSSWFYSLVSYDFVSSQFISNLTSICSSKK